MLINFSSQTINDFFIPSFTLAKGEIVIINISGGSLFYPTTRELTQMLTGKVVNDHIEISLPFKFVAHFKESTFRDRFFPMTIDTYHKKFANPTNPVYRKIYDVKWMVPETKVNTLAGKARKLLSLYTTLSWTNLIISDFVGLNPHSGEEIYDLIKEIAEGGGAVIMFDFSDEFRDECTRFVKAEYVGDK